MTATPRRATFAALAAIGVAFGLHAAGPANASGSPLAAQPPREIPRTAGFFDYMVVDPPMHRLIVSHTGSDSVAFVNTGTGVLERQLYVGATHGIAVDAYRGVYYIGVSGAQKGVVVIDRSTLALRTRISTPGPVDALTFDPKRLTLMADEDNGDSIWVISSDSRQVIATVRTPVDSDKAEYDPVTDRVYQNFTTINATIVFDPARFTELARYSTLPARKPHGLAIDALHRRLYAAGTNGRLAVLDMNTGRIVAALPIAQHVDQIALDVRRHRLYCASGDGVVSVLDVRDGNATRLADVAVPHGTHTIAVDPSSGAVWISYGAEHADFVMKLAPR